MTVPADDSIALNISHVVKKFGQVNAVDGLSFQARRGEVLALLGPNGAGKTTTISMCEGFLKPDSGSITVVGLDVTKNPQAVREKIGIMLQGGGGYSGITVEEMLRLSASYNANPHDPEWLLQILGLEAVRKTTYRRLSGGQQQKLSLALALIGRPELVFLDEPTAGVDAQSRIDIWNLIFALKRDGVTVILTTHLMDEAESLADYVVIIDHGKAVAQGTPAELTTGISHRIHIITAVALDMDRLANEAQLERDAISSVRPLEYSIAAPESPALIARIAAACAAQEVSIRSLEVAHRSLEDVFLDITGAISRIGK
ncbi:ABC transporter ATP-binding protein [Corynebacterium caspium]|uniref:ABC transporter ATP-binding protein n=1 Tax=Corynebacterium caspium TaxID=234828 RepID=UPI00037FDCFD|nr:ABC transporter ATP-binding protein [Corynebacterium caspium]WKD59262.1 Daunorubicin/doxorubicin resistance ATP-binding protein DrrA [Corynebacterium caspium DSM 44850]